MYPISKFLYVNICKRYVQEIQSGNKDWAHLTRAKGPVAGVWERSNEHSCFRRSRDFLYSVSIAFSKMDFHYGIRKFHLRSSVNIH
jgi:hypothetical protein